jgi:hypothetical protein
MIEVKGSRLGADGDDRNTNLKVPVSICMNFQERNHIFVFSTTLLNQRQHVSFSQSACQHIKPIGQS